MNDSNEELAGYRDRLSPFFAPGTRVETVGKLEACTSVNRAGVLDGITTNMHWMLITSAGIVVLGQSVYLGMDTEYGIDAIPWGVVREIIEPTSMLQGDRRGINVVMQNGGVLQTSCFPGSAGSEQSRFHAQGASIAQRLFAEARANGSAQGHAVVPLLRTKIPSRPTLNDYLRMLIRPRLRSGETVEQVGLVTTNDAQALGMSVTTPGAQTLFALGTSQRLLLVQTSLTPRGNASAECRGAASLELGQIHPVPGSASATSVRFALDAATGVTLDFTTPHAEVPTDATFRASFSGWLAQRAASTPPPPPSSPRAAAEPWGTPIDAFDVARTLNRNEEKGIAPGGASPGASIALLAVGALFGLAAAWQVWECIYYLMHGNLFSEHTNHVVKLLGLGLCTLVFVLPGAAMFWRSRAAKRA